MAATGRAVVGTPHQDAQQPNNERLTPDGLIELLCFGEDAR
jgi:hypothetical protein